MLRLVLLCSFVAIFLALAYAAAVAIRMHVLIRKSGELVAKSVPFQHLVTHAHPRILILGDSTAVGTGVDDPRLSIAGRFSTEFPDAEVRNLGINGLRTPELARDFPSFPERSFDIVLLQIGANDILRGTPLPEFSRSLEIVFGRARVIGTHVIALHSGNIGLAPLFVWPLNVYFRTRTLRYREIYRQIAQEKGVLYVDLFHEAADDPFADHERFYSADLLHLSGEGYRVWYEDVRAAMKRAGIFFG